jgi:hypothetical protein
MGYLSHPYAWRLASASFAGATTERLQYRDTLDVVIRFADWRGRRFNPKALEIGEDELLVLIGDGIAAGVFSTRFVQEIRGIIGVGND